MDEKTDACQIISSITKEMADLREAMRRNPDQLLNDAFAQYQFQALMLRGLGIALESIRLILEGAT